MATRIRLARRGRKKLAIYDVVVADSRSPRDGKFIEKIGQYNPNTNPATIDLKEDKALDWLMKGAQPSDTARVILSYKGLMLKRHLQVGVLKGAITEDQANAKFEEWKNTKEEKVSQKVDGLSKEKEADKRARLEAETKVKEARAEAIRKKEIVEEAPAEVEAVNESTEAVAETEVVDAEVPTVETPEAVETPEVKEETAEEAKEEEKKEEVSAPEEQVEPEAVAEEAVATPEAAAEEVKEEEPAAEETTGPEAIVEEALSESGDEAKKES